MGALPKPQVPDGPVRELFEALHALHHRAGWPSLREMAKEVGCSHTTVSAAFSEPRVARWGLLELIVEALDGDTDHFHRLWLTATATATSGEVADPGEPAGPPGGGPVPRDLLPDVAGFTGRDGELAALDRLLAGAGGSTAVTIAAVSGTAGAGKTALAVHWAHRVADRFPDGQLAVDLRGYDPERPVEPAQALEAFLRELGVPGTAIPAGVAERAARYRTLVAGRRMLVLLDNARSVEQVRDLLPGTPSCFVLVTSRDTLPGLVARHGAVRVGVDVLPLDDAVTLLRHLTAARTSPTTAPPATTDPHAGADPPTAVGARGSAGARGDDEAAAVALARRCACLPLALRIAAETAVGRPEASLADLVAELGDETRLLDLLDAGEDDRTAVRAVLSWSHRNLAAPAAAAFPLLGLHPGTSLDAAAVAALTTAEPAGTEPGGLAVARRVLEALARAHLVEPVGAGRYRMHDLLRAYAAELVGGLPAERRRAALDRLAGHYVRAAREAARDHQRDPARGWLDAERPAILAVAARRPDAAAALSEALGPYLDSRAWYQDALALHGHALAAARAAGDRAGEARALNLLAVVHRRLGRYPEALDRHGRALELHRALGDRAGTAESLRGLGVVGWRLGRYGPARDQLDEARALFEELGDPAGTSSVLDNLGVVYRRLGRYPEALAHYRRGIALHRELGNRIGEAGGLNNIGIVYLRLGRNAEARSHFERSLAIQREAGHRTGEAVALVNLGLAVGRLGDPGRARGHLAEALAIDRPAGYRIGEADAWHGLGVVHHRLGETDRALTYLRRAIAIGRELGEADLEAMATVDVAGVLRDTDRPAEAAEAYRRALALATGTGDRYEQARALDGLAVLDHAAGDPAAARDRWQQALDRYAELGVPEAAATRVRLRQLPSTAVPGTQH